MNYIIKVGCTNITEYKMKRIIDFMKGWDVNFYKKSDWNLLSCFGWNRNSLTQATHVVNNTSITLLCMHSAGMLLAQPVIAVLHT